VTNAKISGILESTKKQLHHCWFAVCTGLVFGFAILLLLNSISTYRWVSRPIVLEQPRYETMRAPIVARTAVFSPLTHHQNAEWSLRRALYINVVASLALLVALTLLGLRMRA
jgi:hypothetical protein